jgi:peroxiredoxin (alkyl hydroperoxide reductase subunit C)
MGLQLGLPAPDFTLKDQNNQDVTLSRLRGTPVLLVFYPLAFSGVCCGELCALRDDLPQLAQRVGSTAELLTASVDSVFVHRVWAEQEGFGFRLLSDFWPHGAVARRTFAIDAAGVLCFAAVNDIPVGRKLSLYGEALAAVA